MAAWHNLAGYLTLRPVGALSRLKTRKKLWYVLDESKCQLLYYKNESDANEGKTHLGAINVKGSAISLALEDSNQFVIHSEGKEYILIADNHESMMLWVLALQAKQDLTDKKSELSATNKNSKLPKNSSLKEFQAKNGRMNKLVSGEKSKIVRTHSLQLHGKGGISERSSNLHNPLTRMRSLLSTLHSVESEFVLSEKDHSRKKSNLSSVTQSIDRDEEAEGEISEEDEDIEITRRPTVIRNEDNEAHSSSSTSTTSPLTPGHDSVLPLGNISTESQKSSSAINLFQPSKSNATDTESEDEHFRDPVLNKYSIGSSVHPVSTDVSFNADKLALLRKINSEGLRTEDASQLKDRASSLSGTSVSSDSAVGASECAHSVRIQELESELMLAKCDLAKALNREASYKCVIEEKRNLVTELEDRLKIIDDTIDDNGKSSPAKSSYSIGASTVKRLQEKCRILQNHNRFLNEEVLKLSKILQQEQGKNHLKQMQVLRIEKENEQLKRDFVFLLQSSLKITNTDGPETLEVFMYGEARHKQRVLSLLEEARKINPTLPAYENLTRSICHVDPLGFRRQFSDEGLVLHYICRQLHQHYCTVCPTYEVHQQKWRKYLKQHETLHRTKELKALVRGGIPAHLRSRVWILLYKSQVQDIIDDKGSHYYSYLCSLAPDDERVSQHKRQIALDLLRTIPDNIRFSNPDADGVRKMQEVLQAFCLHNPSLGYCQGMNFLVGMCLLFLEPEDAFWCLVAITERYFTPNYFDQNLIGAQADQEVLKDLLRERMPNLWCHLVRLDIELCTVTLNWFLAIFFDCIPFETLLRIWDCFFLEGPKVLFRFALAILKLNEKSILMRHETVSIMRQLKAAARLCFDVDSLFKTAFESMKPFTRRQDIAAKQACYYKTLREHARKMEMEKDALKDKEKMLSEMERLNANQLVIECAAMYDKDKLWLCHGHQNGAQISKVNCEENIMYRLNIQFESRVMCMHALDDDTMLLGTLSHFVHAYSTRARRLLWEVRLNDAVLALSSYEEDGLVQVYAGLADGTIAVIENVKGEASKPEVFYILICSSPITCISLVDHKLWCGSGNRIIILSARTLDTLDQFQTSSSVLDYISMLVPEEQGVWVTIRGSSVLQLWDAQNLTCKLLFDVKDNRYPKPLKQQDDETAINHARITAVLPFGKSVLVGTAEGILIIFDIVARISRSASTPDFTARRQVETTPVDHIQERIQELLEEQKKREESDESICGRERSRTDSGCYSTPCRTPLHASSRRESQHVNSDSMLPTQLEDVEDEPEMENSPEDRSEATSVSTIRQAGFEHLLSTPDSQLAETVDVISTEEPQSNASACISASRKLPAMDTDRDSGRSSSSTQGKLCDDDITGDGKRLCTCHQLTSRTVKCRHCLLETSEALRQLFNKYSLGTSQTNHIESSMRCQKLLSNSKMLRKEISNPDRVSSNLLTSDLLNEHPPECDPLKSDNIFDNSYESGNNESTYSVRGIEELTYHGNDVIKVTATPPRNRRFDPCGKITQKKPLFRAISADDVTKWVKSQENLSSSFGSDSYDFDDVFVTYTEDENDRVGNWLHNPSRSGLSHNKETEALLESIRARSLSRRRSSNICDYTFASSSCGNDQWHSPWYSGKSRSSSPWMDTPATSISSFSCGRNRPLVIPSPTITRPRLLDIRTQLPSWNCASDSEKQGPNIKPVMVGCSDDTSPNEWLSYEDSITENDSSTSKMGTLNKDLLHLADFSSSTQKGSDTASNVSFCSTDVPYTFELNLQEKIKISDKAIKCLLETRCGGEPTIVSCAGCYGDDEAVLKWTRLGDEKLWTNDPIIEICPYTNAIKPSPYVRSRLPRRTTSLASTSSETELSSRNAIMSAVSSPGSVVGSGLAKVQNMLLRVHDKV